MICLSCPKCDADVEFTFDSEEVLHGMSGCYLVPVVDEMRKTCDCKWTESERSDLITCAERAECEREP